MLKKSIVLFLFFLFFSPFTVSATDFPEQTREFYVADFANVLSSEIKDFIINSNERLYKETDAQIVVATVSSLNGMEIKNYALELGRKWKVGGKEKNNGLVILLAPNERKIAISVATGLEGKINDSKAGRFIRQHANPYFKDKKWNDGIKKLFSVLINEIYSEYGKSSPVDIKNNLPRALSLEEIFIGLIFVVALSFVLISFRKKIRKRVDKRMYKTLFFLFKGNRSNNRKSSQKGFFGGFGENDRNSSSGNFSGGGGGGFDGGGASSDF